MKTNVVILLLTFIISLGFAQENNTSFGEEISIGNVISSDLVIKTLGNRDSMELRVEGEIKEVCQMKGCWMTMSLGNGETMRITFRDYAFFVPKDASGALAIVEGVARYEEQSVATLKHYAEDAGKSEEEIVTITESTKKLTFEAAGVLIKSKS